MKTLSSEYQTYQEISSVSAFRSLILLIVCGTREQSNSQFFLKKKIAANLEPKLEVISGQPATEH